MIIFDKPALYFSIVMSRALQFARPTIVRAGSLMAHFRETLGSGVILSYGNIEEASQQLMSADLTPEIPASRYETGRRKLVQLIEAHRHA